MDETTPLRQCHLGLGARLVSFAGWEMPLQYSSILEEARRVRARGGLFDLCHMGRVRVTGKEAETLLQRVVTNDVAKIKPGAIRYAMITREDGGVLDDVLVYRDPEIENSFFVVVNAANRTRDLDWMRSHANGMQVDILDQTHELAMIALQGPVSPDVLAPHTSANPNDLKYYTWIHSDVSGVPCSMSRTGYTGEDGFELYVPRDEVRCIWETLLETGICPIGLAARDTLRLEAAMALYGHELTEDINPYEARLGWAVKLKTDFIGRDALAEVKEQGPRRLLAGLVTESRRVPRQGYKVLREGREIGVVASGTFSPALNKNIATAFLEPMLAVTGTEVAVLVRNKEVPARVTDLPFYQRQQ
ncbi:MAG: glycine cleavage system aminomethyltransferase GcvT [Planctomycetota bacterium]